MKRCCGKRVLHLGCSSGSYITERIKNENLLHLKLLKVCKELYGIDINRPSLNILSERFGLKNIFQGDVEHLEDLNIDKTFEVIVAGEIIEHLSNPGLMLEGIKRFMDNGCELIITTPNSFSLPKFIAYALGNYTEHPAHTISFSTYTLGNLLERFGYKIEESYGAFIVLPVNYQERILLSCAKPFLKLFPKFAGTLVVAASLK